MVFIVPSITLADEILTAEESFTKGNDLYEAEQYDEAIPYLEHAVKAEPENAIYHHVLAKSYGREAEKVNWFSAMNYASKTRQHLETAVELETNNIQYLDDLMDYYREAPQFLGGNKKKAEALRLRIEQLTRMEKSDFNEAYDKQSLAVEYR